ncbi:MAG: hypothetical protein EAZ32_06270 [Cytophagia bacterium]|nr:MAG: hypothetical protein EAZ32_06270 [Cytophagia bacterium]
MTTATVQQGQNADNIGYGLLNKPRAMRAIVRFTDSCIYNHNNADQADWNKLMGFFDGYFNNPRSVRWGWRWSVTNNCIEIAPYVHHAGSIILPPSSQWIQIPINAWVELRILIDRPNNKYVFKCSLNGNNTTHEVAVNSLANTYESDCFWDLLYFGGSQTAPQNVSVDYNVIVVGALRRYRCHSATSSWRVSYTDSDLDRNSYYGTANEDITIIASAGSLVTTLGNVQVTDLGPA